MAKNKATTVVVDQKEEAPIERHVLAGAIVEISSAVKRLTARGGLTKEAVVILTQHNCRSAYKFGVKPGIADVRSVLDSLEELQSKYVQK